MDEVTDAGQFSEDSHVDLLVFGRRLRHLRRARGLTLRELGARVGKHPPYLSQVENGRREPSLSLVGALARALGTSRSELLAPSPPTRRAELEIALERAQRDPLWRGELELPPLAVSAGTQTPVLETLVQLFDEVKRRGQVRAETPEGARRANVALREEMQGRDNYFPEIEAKAAEALQAVGYRGEGPLSQRLLGDLARHLGFTLHPVRDLPGSVRSVTDLRHRRIYVGQRDRVAARLARPMVVQTLGHFLLGHSDPGDFGEFLRQRVEANYFAGAVLVPEQAAVPLLVEAKRRRDLSVQDLEERFYVSHEMAAHRLTNLATHHLDIPVHFLRTDAQGVIWKAYENDGAPLPKDPQGAIEGQLLCRYWGPRRAFGSEQAFSVHNQYTDTPAGTFWDSTYVEVEREPHHAIGLGTRYEEARYFRGSDTRVRTTSRCPEGPCCRRPPADLATRWDGRAWPSPRPQSHVLAALPAGTFPGVDLFEVYEFLEAHAPRAERRGRADSGASGVDR
jgi:transcriptional regulator with XRE-family HTH domain/predicted transcriptional regulator